MFRVYILQNAAGQFYIGHTEDLPARLYSHNRTDKLHGKLTRKNGPWEPVWTEEHACRPQGLTLVMGGVQLYAETTCLRLLVPVLPGLLRTTATEPPLPSTCRWRQAPGVCNGMP
jgi:hypothetical protein